LLQEETELVVMDGRTTKDDDLTDLTRMRNRTSSVITGGNLAATALRFKRKEALPGGGGLRHQGKDQVLSDVAASDGEQESSTEE